MAVQLALQPCWHLPSQSGAPTISPCWPPGKTFKLNLLLDCHWRSGEGERWHTSLLLKWIQKPPLGITNPKKKGNRVQPVSHHLTPGGGECSAPHWVPLTGARAIAVSIASPHSTLFSLTNVTWDLSSTGVGKGWAKTREPDSSALHHVLQSHCCCLLGKCGG